MMVRVVGDRLSLTDSWTVQAINSPSGGADRVAQAVKHLISKAQLDNRSYNLRAVTGKIVEWIY